MKPYHAKIIHSVRRTEVPKTDTRKKIIRYEVVSQIRDESGTIIERITPIPADKSEDRAYIKRLTTSIGSDLTNQFHATVKSTIRRTEN